MSSLAKLTMRPYESADEESVLRLLKETLGETPATRRTSDFWSWKHFENPFGPSFVRVACDRTGEVIGLRAFMRWQFRVGTKQIMAVQAVDTATHPAYQRKGVFSVLTRQAVQDVREAGVALIFNTPNIFSRPGYSKLGWLDVGNVTPMFLILRPDRVLSRLLAASIGFGLSAPRPYPSPSLRLISSDGTLLQDPEAAQELMQRHELLDTTATITTNRSTEYLRWRYTRHPHLTYSVITVEARRHPRAACIFRANRRLGLSEVLLAEVFLAERRHALCRGLVDEIKSAVPADYLVAYARPGSFLRRALKKCGFRAPPGLLMNLLLENRFLKLPERQKPRRLMVNPLSSDLPVDPLQLENWQLSAGDIEVF